MNNLTKLEQYLIENGKTHTWFELAEKFNILSELPNTPKNRERRGDYVRKFYSRIKQKAVLKSKASVSIINEFKTFITSKYNDEYIKPYLNGNPNNILVIGDTHIPYQHPDYLDFLLNLQRKWDCGKIIHIGDILDFQSTSYHQAHPEGLSPYYEMEISKLEIKKWKKAFPEMVVTIGNHDRRVSRKMFDGQISSHWQTSLKDVLDVNWEFVNDYVYNDIYFCHGEGVTARVTALQKQMSTVQGHRHSETYIDFPAKGLFAVQTALGVDRKQLAFEYNRTDPREWTIGATIILDSRTPIIEKM